MTTILNRIKALEEAVGELMTPPKHSRKKQNKEQVYLDRIIELEKRTTKIEKKLGKE